MQTQPAPDDHRMHLVRLTAEGQRAVDRALPMGHEITARTLTPLTGPERTALVRLLRKMG